MKSWLSDVISFRNRIQYVVRLTEYLGQIYLAAPEYPVGYGVCRMEFQSPDKMFILRVKFHEWFFPMNNKVDAHKDVIIRNLLTVEHSVHQILDAGIGTTYFDFKTESLRSTICMCMCIKRFYWQSRIVWCITAQL